MSKRPQPIFGPSTPPLNVVGGYRWPGAPDVGLISNTITEAAEIVADDKHPGMWRVWLPDERLSDMLNLSRARELARRLVPPQAFHEAAE